MSSAEGLARRLRNPIDAGGCSCPWIRKRVQCHYLLKMGASVLNLNACARTHKWSIDAGTPAKHTVRQTVPRHSSRRRLLIVQAFRRPNCQAICRRWALPIPLLGKRWHRSRRVPDVGDCNQEADELRRAAPAMSALAPGLAGFFVITSHPRKRKHNARDIHRCN